jgi:hypothetical protein
MLDQDLAHHAACDCKEMTFVVGANGTCACRPHVKLMNKRRWLKRLAGEHSREVRRCNPL